MTGRERDALGTVRVIIKHVMSLTQETYVDIGMAIGMRPAVVGRRQSGTTKWTVDELGCLARHWGVPLWCLFTDVQRVLHEMDVDRVTELRAAKDLAPLHFKPPTPIAA